ncbi:MAG: ABC-F family ATP-binding cassette domain-containing protein, partial [Candidatus Zixiibacteriota bacterium]
MTLLSAENICKKFNDQVILDGVSFTVKTGDHIGLVGKNGIGKTTLFEIIVGNLELDSGVFNRSKACIISYIEQDKTEYFDHSLFDFVASARTDLLQMRQEIVALQGHLAVNPHDERNLAHLGRLQSDFEHNGGFTFESEIRAILEGLGFESNRFSEPLRNFSGGEKNRAALARTLAGKSNLLLLDEPTNHLDIDSTAWLEEYLSKCDKSYLVVSHDRAFLTATVEKIWEITFGKLEFYRGGFEKYLTERADRKRIYEHRYKHQQEEIKRIEEFVRRNIAGQKTRQAQSKLKYLNRIKRLPPPKNDEQAAIIP